MPPINIAVIGYGSSAKTFHIPLIVSTSSLRLHSIVQRSPSRDNDAGVDHPGVKIYRSSADVVADTEVDVVVITTPPGTHVGLGREALEGGKHGMLDCSGLWGCWGVECWGGGKRRGLGLGGVKVRSAWAN